MFVNTLRRLTSGPKPVALLFLLLFASLYLMSSAIQNSALFGQLYSLLLVINMLALLLLLALIGRNLVGLIMQYRRNSPGSRLTVRLVVMLVVIGVMPVTLLFYFSVQFLQRGIDSWFDLPMESTMEASLELGRSALDQRLREGLRQTRLYAERLKEGGVGAPLMLNDLLRESDALELSLFTAEGRIIAGGSLLSMEVVPDLPDESILRQLRQGLEYSALEPLTEGGMQLRVAVPLPEPAGEDAPILQAIYPVAASLAHSAEQLQEAYAQYRELAYLRRPLIDSFTLTLSLVLLLSLLTAVWAAFFSARRLVAPIRDLAEGTRAVAAGDYDKQLPLPSRDELGFLVRSFNEMTRKIARSRDQARQSQQQLLEQHAYLETVLGHLSSGVLTLAPNGSLLTANTSAAHVLGVELADCLDESLESLPERYPNLAPLVHALQHHLQAHDSEWQEEVLLFGGGGRQILMCSGSSLPAHGEEEHGGHVIVFDDLTTLLQAQRDAAWGEVARRMAHEIKNPLTPIQLSAERLRRRYLGQMEEEEGEVLDRATHTIIQQVVAMKEMVQAFSDYARTPQLKPTPLNLNDIIHEVLELYRGNPRLRIDCALDPELPVIEADAGRLRQLLHNLIKNADEAHAEEQTVALAISSQCLRQEACRFVELRIRDRGPGFPEELLDRLFEPYVTDKPRGSGLGLAVVKKIVEEHGGIIWAENGEGGGATITIRLPVQQGE